MIATVVSVALVWWSFIPAEYSLAKTPAHLFSTGAFFVMGVLFGVFHERLRSTNQKSQAMVREALDCIISMDAHGRVTEWNPAAAAVAPRLSDAVEASPPSERSEQPNDSSHPSDTAKSRVLIERPQR